MAWYVSPAAMTVRNSFKRPRCSSVGDLGNVRPGRNHATASSVTSDGALIRGRTVSNSSGGYVLPLRLAGSALFQSSWTAPLNSWKATRSVTMLPRTVSAGQVAHQATTDTSIPCRLNSVQSAGTWRMALVTGTSAPGDEDRQARHPALLQKRPDDAPVERVDPDDHDLPPDRRGRGAQDRPR